MPNIQQHTNPGRPPQAPALGVVPRLARAVGAIALLAVGGVHLEQYTVAYFSTIPTIGSLFLANFVGATAFGLVLLVPIGSAAGFRRLLVDSLVALAGIGLAAGAFAGLVISEHTPLFGFMEHGYRLEIVIALAAEAITVAALAVFLASAQERLRALGRAGTGAGAPDARALMPRTRRFSPSPSPSRRQRRS